MRLRVWSTERSLKSIVISAEVAAVPTRYRLGEARRPLVALLVPVGRTASPYVGVRHHLRRGIMRRDGWRSCSRRR